MVWDSMAGGVIPCHGLPDFRDGESASGGISAAGSIPSISAYHHGAAALCGTFRGGSHRSGAAVYHCRVPAASAICRNHNYIFRQSFRGKVYDNDRASYQVKGTFADGRRAKFWYIPMMLVHDTGTCWTLPADSPHWRTATSGTGRVTTEPRGFSYRRTMTRSCPVRDGKRKAGAGIAAIPRPHFCADLYPCRNGSRRHGQCYAAGNKRHPCR